MKNEKATFRLSGFESAPLRLDTRIHNSNTNTRNKFSRTACDDRCGLFQMVNEQYNLGTASRNPNENELI